MRIGGLGNYLQDLVGLRPPSRESARSRPAQPTPRDLLSQSIAEAKRSAPLKIIVFSPLYVLKFDHHLLLSQEGKLYVFRRVVSFKREQVFHAMFGAYAPTGSLTTAEIEVSEIGLPPAQRAFLFKSIDPACFSPSEILLHPFVKEPLQPEMWNVIRCGHIYANYIHPMILKVLRDLRIDPAALMVDLGGGDGLLAEKIVGEYPNPFLLIEKNEIQAQKSRLRLGNKVQVAAGDAEAIKAIVARRFAGKNPKVVFMSGLATFQVLTEQKGRAILKAAFESLETGGSLILTGRMPILWNAGDLARAGFALRKTFDLDRFLERGEYFEIYVIEKQAPGAVDFDRLQSTVMRSQAWAKDFRFWETESRRPEIMRPQW